MFLLEVTDLYFRYGNARVLEGVSLTVDEGEIVTIIGPNGAGKSTLLNVISRSLRARSGSVRLAGEDITKAGQSHVVRSGCILVPEGRQVFPTLTVLDNLLLGGYVHRGGSDETLARVYRLFPRLKQRAIQLAGTMSGGEQQMLAIGRAMMGRPKIMLLDEPSLGLSPQMVKRIFDALEALRAEGTTLLLVEQNALAALGLADRGYLLQTGSVVTSGTVEELSADPNVKKVYLGASGDEDLTPAEASVLEREVDAAVHDSGS